MSQPDRSAGFETNSGRVGSRPLSLEQLNRLPAEQAETLLIPCLDIDRSVRTLVDHRPYAQMDELIETPRQEANPFTDEEVEAPLAHHPRIRERASGGSAEAALSRSDQARVVSDEDVQCRLQEGNRAYEQRFGRGFLIRGAGRSAEEILASLESRLATDEQTERSIIADQLREIALLRLAGVVAP